MERMVPNSSIACCGVWRYPRRPKGLVVFHSETPQKKGRILSTVKKRLLKIKALVEIANAYPTCQVYKPQGVGDRLSERWCQSQLQVKVETHRCGKG